ncbi:MAG: hypothetical protein JWR04_480 [Rhodoglobus sp.]|nr:hypothetical protein [Rhodoglobus sp.]
MLALQSQDLPGARWAIGLRLPGCTDADVERALGAGEIVRSWPMRGTLHIVAPEDLGWMLDIAAVRQATWAAKRRRDLEITDEQLAGAGNIAAALMRGGSAVRRDALLSAWEERGIPTTGQRGYHLLWNLAHAKLIVFGPPDAKQPTFALFEEWVTSHRALSGDEALAELATRYFRSHGPATERDFAWWASITLGDARKGIAAAEGLERRDFDGVGHYLAAGLEAAASGVYALPGFDEYMLGYQDRSPALAAEYAPRIVPGNNGMFLPTVVVDGEVVGTWKRIESAKKATVELSEFRSMTKKGRAGLERALRRYGEFIGKPVELRERDE